MKYSKSEPIPETMTEQQHLKILALIYNLRKIAAPIGPLHAYWDVIFDMQAFTEGKLTLVQYTAEEWILYAERLLAENKKKSKSKKEKEGKWGFSELMVLAAFRYCCGRRSYIVKCCVDWLIEQWPNFSDQTKDLIHRELDDEFKEDGMAKLHKRYVRSLGDDYCRGEWERVRSLWS